MKIELKLIDTPSDRAKAREIVTNYHSYVPNFNSIGRRVDFLVYLDDEIVGMIGIGSSTYPPCKDLLRYLNISKDEYKKDFNSFANNWRYCLIKHVPNLGTQVLKQLRIQGPIEWYKKYGDTLKYLITYIGADKSGAVYKADNWKEIGKTAGLPEHKAVSMKWDSNEKLKDKFVKPTGENQKLIFITPVKLDMTKDNSSKKEVVNLWTQK